MSWQLWFDRWAVTKGGPGSGHWGHAGRPGKHGGSAPSKGGVASGKGSVVGSWDVSEKVYKACFGSMSKGDVEQAFVLEGYSAQFTVGMNEAGTAVNIVCEWADKDGNFVGGTVQALGLGGTEKIWYCEELLFDAGFQNKGLATELWEKQVALAKEAGFAEVRLVADSSIGTYAWAKKGFDYAASDGASYATTKFKEWATNKGISISADKMPTFKSAKDVADFSIAGVTVRGSDIRNPDVPKDMELHLGKAFMLDYKGHGAWDGVLKL